MHALFVKVHALFVKVHALFRTFETDGTPYVRRDDGVSSRLKLGHSYLTPSYLLKGEPPPECVAFHCRIAINHILVKAYLIMYLQTKSSH